MLTDDDYRPWLLEINCSPTLAQSTHVTKRLCQNVVEDTMKGMEYRCGISLDVWWHRCKPTSTDTVKLETTCR